MKTVYLLRHAKSSWDLPELPDLQRPLARRGRKDAPRMGAFMAREGMVPAHVLCSAARRARETWELVAEALETEVPVEITEGVYHASPGELMALIQGLPGALGSILLVGHNPAMEDLALALVATGDPQALRRLETKYPTGSLAVLDFSTTSWGDVREGRGHLRAFIRPKDVG